MNAGKARYDSIPVPAELESAIDAGISRAEKRAPTRRLKHALAGVAAAVCIMFAGANIMPVYSYAADIPVLGSIVRVLHIGSGGEVTDGAQVGADTAGDRVELTFGDMASAPVLHRRAPQRPQQDSAQAARRARRGLRVHTRQPHERRGGSGRVQEHDTG